MCKLIRGGELELAVSVGLVLKSVDAQLRVAVELLSRRCEQLGRWSVSDVFSASVVRCCYGCGSLADAPKSLVKGFFASVTEFTG